MVTDRLLNVKCVVSKSEYTTYKNLAMVINQMERMWKEAVFAYLQILTSHFSGERIINLAFCKISHKLYCLSQLPYCILKQGFT